MFCRRSLPEWRTPHVLFLSNGHGEDLVAGQLIDRVCEGRRGFRVAGWAMVGAGLAYEARGVPRGGAANTLPSEGFATLSLAAMWRDLRAGWIRVHRDQYQAALACRGRYDLAVAVGDIVPILAAVVARLPFIFVGCTKSSRYGWGGRYNAIETHLMRRGGVCAFARDPETARHLVEAGVRARYVGNPMMDGLEPRVPLQAPAGRAVVVLLPGSRAAAVDNVIDLLAVAEVISAAATDAGRPHFVCTPAPNLPTPVLLDRVVRGPEARGWVPDPMCAAVGGGACRLTLPAGATVDILPGRLVDAINRATVVIGLAGTANEQAVGLGRPLVTFPGRGPSARAYSRMKARYFGDAAVTVEPHPHRVAGVVLDLLRDPERRDRMGRIGRDFMGPPGAGEAMAATIVSTAERLAG